MTVQEAENKVRNEDALEYCQKQSMLEQMVASEKWKHYHYASEALEKQIPKKPKGISVNEDNMRVANCPNCGKFIVQKESPIGCKNCLQKLDWEEGGTSD